MAARKIELLLFLALLVSSCAEKPPIPQNKFVEIYVQLQLIGARYGNDPALQKSKSDSLLKAFDVDRPLVDSTLSWYSRDPDRWHDFFEVVERRFDEIRHDYPGPVHR